MLVDRARGPVNDTGPNCCLEGFCGAGGVHSGNRPAAGLSLHYIFLRDGERL
jgi:hypothetical protein